MSTFFRDLIINADTRFSPIDLEPVFEMMVLVEGNELIVLMDYQLRPPDDLNFPQDDVSSFDFHLQTDSFNPREWNQVVSFTAVGQVDPNSTYTVPDKWKLSEVPRVQNLVLALNLLRNTRGLRKFTLTQGFI